MDVDTCLGCLCGLWRLNEASSTEKDGQEVRVWFRAFWWAFGALGATLQTLNRFALWPCHTLRDVVELVANNLRPSFRGCGPLQLARYCFHVGFHVHDLVVL